MTDELREQIANLRRELQLIHMRAGDIERNLNKAEETLKKIEANL